MAEAWLFAPHIFQSNRAVPLNHDDVIPAKTMDVDATQNVWLGGYKIPLNRSRRQSPFIAMNFAQPSAGIADTIE